MESAEHRLASSGAGLIAGSRLWLDGRLLKESFDGIDVTVSRLIATGFGRILVQQPLEKGNCFGFSGRASRATDMVSIDSEPHPPRVAPLVDQSHCLPRCATSSSDALMVSDPVN
jgi:hypothetical protein